jgi:hypothetical protein
LLLFEAAAEPAADPDLRASIGPFPVTNLNVERQEIYRSVFRGFPGDCESKEDANKQYSRATRTRSYRNLRKAVVKAHCPELVIPRRFTTDPRDEEIRGWFVNILVLDSLCVRGDLGTALAARASGPRANGRAFDVGAWRALLL